MRLAALGLAFAGSKVASRELPGVGTNRGTLKLLPPPAKEFSYFAT